jgi:hypothetical protein
MMDDLDWEQHCRAFDDVVREHRDRPLPETTLGDHHRLFMARMRADLTKQANASATAINRPGGSAALQPPPPTPPPSSPASSI